MPDHLSLFICKCIGSPVIPSLEPICIKKISFISFEYELIIKLEDEVFGLLAGIINRLKNFPKFTFLVNLVFLLGIPIFRLNI